MSELVVEDIASPIPCGSPATNPGSVRDSCDTDTTITSPALGLKDKIKSFANIKVYKANQFPQRDNKSIKFIDTKNKNADASLKIIDPKHLDTKSELKKFVEKVKLLNKIQKDVPKSPRISRENTNPTTSKTKEKIIKSRQTMIKFVESMQVTERLPLWKFKAKGIYSPDKKYILKGKRLWKAIVVAIIGITIRPIRIRNTVKLLTRDQECLELTRAIQIYSESCDLFMKKCVIIPMTSLCQDNTLDFVPQTFMRKGMRDRKLIQLKVRLYSFINGVASSGMLPDHIINFLDSISEDENYFPSGFLFHNEKKFLNLSKLGSTRNMVSQVHENYLPENYTTVHTTRNLQNELTHVNSRRSLIKSSSFKSLVSSENQKSDSFMENFRYFFIELKDPNSDDKSKNNDLQVFDVTKVKIIVSNFLIVRTLISHLCLHPWVHSGYTPDDTYVLKSTVNCRILASLLYEVARRMDSSVLPSMEEIGRNEIIKERVENQAEREKRNKLSERNIKATTIAPADRPVSTLSNTPNSSSSNNVSIFQMIGRGLGWIDDKIKRIDEDTFKSKEICNYLYDFERHHTFCNLQELQYILYPLDHLNIGFGEETIEEWINHLAPILNEWVESVTYEVVMKRSEKLFESSRKQKRGLVTVESSRISTGRESIKNLLLPSALAKNDDIMKGLQLPSARQQTRDSARGSGHHGVNSSASPSKARMHSARRDLGSGMGAGGNSSIRYSNDDPMKIHPSSVPMNNNVNKSLKIVDI